MKNWLSLAICVKYPQCVKVWPFEWKLTFIGHSCKISSMCENMAIWVKIWLSLVICLNYPQCVKIWSFEWTFDFHWSFVWNILNVRKYGHLMSCVLFLKSCVLFLMDTTESGLCSTSDGRKGRHGLSRRVSHLKQMRDTRYGGASPFFYLEQKI
jgi:hypothetical protein